MTPQKPVDNQLIEPELPEAPPIHTDQPTGLDPQPAMLESGRRWRLLKRRAGRRASSHFRIILVLIPVVALVVVSLYLVSAYAAYRSMALRLARPTPLSYEGNLVFSGQDFLQAYNSDMGFQGDFNPPQPPLGQALSGSFVGKWAGQNYSGEYTYVDKTAAFRLRGDTMPVLRYRQAPIFYPLHSDQYYSAQPSSSLWGLMCQNVTPAQNPKSADLYRLLRQVKPKLSWVNPAAVSGGRLTANFQGDFESTHFQQIAESLESFLPAGCNLGTFGFSSADAAHFKLHFDVWASSARDTFLLTLSDPTLGAQLKLKIALTYHPERASIVQAQATTNLNGVILDLEKRYLSLGQIEGN